MWLHFQAVEVLQDVASRAGGLESFSFEGLVMVGTLRFWSGYVWVSFRGFNM